MTKKNVSYRNLHLHTDASHLDGLNDIPNLIKRLKEIGHDSCSISDHGNMHNVLKFYRACHENGIKPILGFEAYIFHDHRLQKKEDIEALVEELNDDFVRLESHIVLLAKNFTGYQNLLRLTSLAYEKGVYRRPHIDWEMLKEHSDGVICIDGHVGTRIARAIERMCEPIGETEQERDDYVCREWDRACKFVEEGKQVFGDDFYLEIQNHGLPIEAKTNPHIFDLAEDFNIKIVMTNDSHYTWREDADAHRVHMSNGINKTLEQFMQSDFEGFKDCDEFYVKSDEEMYEMAKIYGDAGIQAMKNTLEIVDKCNVHIDAIELLGVKEKKGKLVGEWKTKEHLFPNFPVPAPYANIEAYFEHLAYEGLEERKNNDELDLEKFTYRDYLERLGYEVNVVKNMGFPAYFIILWDVVDFCHKNGISVGKGRGSGAGSLVLYSLRITDVDPLPFELLFERFLNPDRISLPDVDLDFAYDRIEEVIEYTRQKYGADHVCKIGTFGTLGAKAVVKDVARVLEYPYDKINGITTRIHDMDLTVEKIEQYDFVQEILESDEALQRVFTIAKRLEGLQRHTSQHAAGIIISPFPLTDLIPTKGSGVDLTAQWDMVDCEMLGFVKMDYLRLRTLTVIKHAVESIERHTGEHINIDKIDFTDGAVFEEFRNGNALGIFQFESDGMQALLKKQQPKSIEDLSACNALN